jgi:predicted TIM-barrel fold metal-dependent hydrolase
VEIVDSQVHIWGPDTPQRPWRASGHAHVQRATPVTAEEVVGWMDEGGIDAAIIVPPSWEGDRNDLAIAAARRYPGRFAVMGRVNPDAPGLRGDLPAWREQPGMLGVRVTFLGKDVEMLSDGSADRFWPAAEKANVPVMLLAPGQGAYLGRVAERHPELTLVVDHMNMSLSDPAVRAGKFDAAIADTASLAKYPNVSVKLSAAPNYSHEAYPFRDMTPHLKRLFEAFGQKRCYWGSDMTNGYEKATYRQRITHFTETLDFLSGSDRDWVMGRGILERLRWA